MIRGGGCSSEKNIVLSDEYEHLTKLFKDIERLTTDNIQYFIVNKERSQYTKFVETFRLLESDILQPLQISLREVTKNCARFDVKPSCKGNGYRSIINIVESCLNQTLSVVEQIQRNRDKLFFRSYQMYAELDSYTQVLSRLLMIVQYAIILLDNGADNALFPPDTPKVKKIIDDMMDDFNNISRECFYGRSFGFQYTLTIRQSLQVVGVAMAAYGDGYIRHTDTLSRAVSSVMHSGKYLIDPELRARRITELTQGVDINFCKAFWSLPEEYGAQHAPLLVCPAMDVNLEFVIPADDMIIKTLRGRNYDVKLPKCNEKLQGVKARLLSSIWRDGQIHNVWRDSKYYGPLGPKPRQRSRYLMFHCHGGGFVSQSSKSHEIYLRTWAKELRIPILSIDYSLAPEAAFPHGLNEIFFAYVWALNNLKKLGTTGDKIVFTGDSAGANLVTALTLKLIMHNIRLPDCLVIAYPPYRIQYYPSPSRILCLMDPLLPLGVLKSCIQAYAGDLENGGEDLSKNIGLIKLSSNLYNPISVDLAEEHWEIHNSHHCGQFHSLSETNLDMIKTQLVPIPLHPDEDEEYFSDCPTTDYDSSSTLDDTDTDVIKRNPSYGNVFKRSSSDDVIPRKSSRKISNEVFVEEDAKVSEEKAPVVNAGSHSSLFNSLKSQVSSQVFDMTSRVSSKVLDDIKSTVPTNVFDASTKIFGDLKSGFTNYLYDNKRNVKSVTSDDSGASCSSQPIGGKQTNATNKPKRKRALDKTKPPFCICKECLYPSTECNCNKKWTGKLISSQKHILGRYGSRHSLSGRHRSISMCTTTMEPESVENKNERCNTTACCSRDIEKPDVFHRSVSTSSLNKGRITIKPSISFQMVDKSLLDACKETPNVDNDEFENNIHLAESNYSGFRNPLMSPIFASDKLLRKMPPVTIFACSLDPLFDDSVEFIKRLQNLGNDADLHVLDRLPHGFLNFQVFSPEAHEACDRMIACMKTSLGIGRHRNDSVMAVN